jgi:antitoxin component YwqK of YwqJK toxin-antitoxin module
MTKDIINKNDNGNKHGIQIGYHSNGEPDYKRYYINGKKHGEQIEYHSNGNGHIEFKYYCINGKYVSREEYLAYMRRSKLTIIKDL